MTVQFCEVPTIVALNLILSPLIVEPVVIEAVSNEPLLNKIEPRYTAENAPVTDDFSILIDEVTDSAD